jgi:iron complex outermembrane receptor protein
MIDSRAAFVLLVTAATAASNAPAQSADNSADSNEVLETIVVTARKVEEKINEVPLSITAFSADDLAKRNIESLADVAKYTSGFSFEGYSGGTSPAPIIRGLTQNTLSDRNQNVATFVDGIHIQQQPNIDFSLLDVERIEVLKGPQNSQYGRSAFAGAINYVSAAPKLGEWDGYVSATLGTDERQDFKGSISIPLLGDKLAIRVYGVKSEYDGSWRNSFSRGDSAVAATSQFGSRFDGTDGNVGGWESQAARIQVRYRPIEALTIDASYYRSEVDNEYGATGVIRPSGTTLWGQPFQTNCSVSAAGVQQLYCGELRADENRILVDPRNVGAYTHTDLMTAKIDWDATENLAVSYLYGRNLLDYDALQHSGSPPTPEQEVCGAFLTTPCPTGTPGILLFATGPIDQEAESHELRIDGKAFDQRLTWRLGYYHSKVEDTAFINSSERRRALFADPTGQTIVLRAPLPASRNSDTTDGIFGSASVKIADAWTLDLEGRYNEEERVLIGSPIGPRTFTEFTPRVNFKWQPRDGWMFYASYAEGSKSGGFNTPTADPGFEVFDPETNKTYELGGKQTLLDGRLQLNYALFLVDWKGLQLPTPDNIPAAPPATDPNFIANVSGAESKGIELDAIFALNDNWRVNFAGSYIDPTFDDDVFDLGNAGRCTSTVRVCPPAVTIPRPAPLPAAAAVAVGGNQIPRTPKSKFALGLEYRSAFADWEYSLRGDLSYQDKQFVEILNLAYLPSRTLVDLNFSVTSPDENWSVTLWGKNVTDEAIVSNSFFIGFVNQYTPTLAPGAAWGLTAKYKFNRVQ